MVKPSTVSSSAIFNSQTCANAALKSYAGSPSYNPSSHTETLTVQQIGSASIEIWTDKTTYAKGQTMNVYVQGINPGPAVAVKSRRRLDYQAEAHTGSGRSTQEHYPPAITLA